MPKARSQPRFSLAPVLFKDSAIEGRGVFARRRFEPGDVVVPYAPAQRRLELGSAEADAAAETKLTLVSESAWVIVPDTSVPGGWLCNHSCRPNAAIYSDGEGQIRCLRPIHPGEEVTIFYGWVTFNDPERDPWRCASPRCRGYINFDLTDDDARHCEDDTALGHAFRARFQDYADYLVDIQQEQVLDVIASRLGQLRAQLAASRA
ncbi:MAG: SET domain-containing protein-lysine N-methyltransferase [Myxococcales bacterium]|nr:MAG: SET domain-containing protein-lysine N-methyltransferase [Myxococcales bacterium]